MQLQGKNEKQITSSSQKPPKYLSLPKKYIHPTLLPTYSNEENGNGNHLNSGTPLQFTG